MVARWGFKIRAVGQNLFVHLAQQLSEPEVTPRVCVAKLRRHHAEPQQSRNVGKIVIAGGDKRELEVAANVDAVLLKQAQ